MTYLADVNFWLALAVDDHVHHVPAKEWVTEAPEEGLVFCRITQNGFLRLLTNPNVMKGDVLTARRAWEAYDILCANPRVQFAEEPHGLERSWRDLTRRAGKGPNFWTDAYLIAFAKAGGFEVLTFDRELALHACPQAHLLS
jgi:uncharacterized protein